MLRSLLAMMLVSWYSALLASSAIPTAVTPEARYATILAEAKQAWQQAAQRKNVWRDTSKLIRGAEKAAQTGDYATAQQLAATARQQALNAIQQHDDQIGTGNPAYLYP